MASTANYHGEVEMIYHESQFEAPPPYLLDFIRKDYSLMTFLDISRQCSELQVAEGSTIFWEYNKIYLYTI